MGTKRKDMVNMQDKEYKMALAEKMANNELEFMKKDSEFEFTCIRCGECCRNREDILLNPFDVFHMCRKLGKTPKEVFEKYSDVYIGHDSHLPVVRLKYRQDENGSTCYFLSRQPDGYRCRIQDSKPFVCRAFPLGRVNKFAADDNEKIKERYFLQPDGNCKGSIKAKEEHIMSVVEEWMGGREEMDISDEFSSLYNGLISTLIRSVNLKALDEMQMKSLRDIWYNNYVFTIYAKYDFGVSDRKYLEAFKMNCDSLMEFNNVFMSYLKGVVNLAPVKK